MGQLEELMAHRRSIESNIEKSFGVGFDLNDEFEKARSGVYKDTAENRRLKRVGQKYGSSAAPEQGGATPQGKKAEEGGQKPEGKADSGKLANYASGASDDALKRAAADKNAAPEVKAAAQAELKKRGSSDNLSDAKNEKDLVKRQKKMDKDPKNNLFTRIGVYATGEYAKPEFKKEVIKIAKDNGINMPDYPTRKYMIDLLRNNDTPNLRKELVDAYVKYEGHYEDEEQDRGEDKSEKPSDNSRVNDLKIDNSTFKQSTPEVKRAFNGILKDLYNEKFQGKGGLFDDLMREIDPENGDVEQFIDLSQGEADKQVDELIRKKISPKKLFSLYDNYLIKKWGDEKVRALPTPNAKKRMREMVTQLAENSDYALRTDILNNHKSDSWMENHWDDDSKKLAAAALSCATVNEIVSLYQDENPDDDEENA